MCFGHSRGTVSASDCGWVWDGAWGDSYAAGIPMAGVYSRSARYAAPVDGQEHTYWFYTVGIEGRGAWKQLSGPSSATWT